VTDNCNGHPWNLRIALSSTMRNLVGRLSFLRRMPRL
jgi:hypothetical protein